MKGIIILTIISFLSLLLIYLLDSSQFLLEFHPSVLEPDFDLPLGQAQRMRNLDPPPSSQVVVEVELLLQLESLESCVGLSSTTSGTSVGTFDDWTLINELREGVGKIKPTQNGKRKKNFIKEVYRRGGIASKLFD